MGKCTANNAQITEMTTAMSDLKSLMSGGPSSLGDMTTAQAKIKEGFDILAGKNTGPITLTYCQNFDDKLVEQDNDFNPITPTSEAACVAAGGTWVEKEVENFNLHDELAKLNTSTSGLDFGTKIQDIKNKFSDLVPDLNEKIKAVSPEAGNFAENFKMPEIPKAGDIVDICTCSDPLYTDQESCEANGGTWNCRKGPMPDIGSLFSGLSSGQLPTGNNAGIFSGLGINMESLSKQASGFFGGTGKLPTLNANSICKFCENIEVKDKVVTDPTTGKQTVEKAKEIPALNPKVAEEPPKIAPPSPPVNIDRKLGDMLAINSFHRAVTRSLESWMMTFTGKKWNMPKKDAKRVIQVLQYYGWRDFAENVNADFNFVLKIMAIPSVANLTAEKIYAVWVMFYRDYVKKTLTAAGIEKSEKRMWKIWKSIYGKETTSQFSFEVAALIAWKDALEKSSKSADVVPEYSEPEKVKQNTDIIEAEEPPPAEPAPTGKKSVTIRGNVITYDNVTIKYNPNSGGFNLFFDDKPKVVGVPVYTQEDLDAVYKIYKAKSGTHVAYSVDRNSGRNAKTTYTGATRSSKYEFV